MIIIDCEGDPVQELSAIYVNDSTCTIEDCFHHYAHYPYSIDYDIFARRHVHGLHFEFLRQQELLTLCEVIDLFKIWLKFYPTDKIYAHGPAKEKQLLALEINDACLKPWAERVHMQSHQVALNMKLKKKPVCGIICSAHSQFVNWKPKNVYSPSVTDIAKMHFQHHCSLYDCMEIFLSISFHE